VPAPGARTRGLVLSGLRAADWEVLDAFEGDAYEARRLDVTDGRPVLAYVWRDRARVADDDWDPAVFAARHLRGYVSGCAPGGRSAGPS
jgi:hypothetical protein